MALDLSKPPPIHLANERSISTAYVPPIKPPGAETPPESSEMQSRSPPPILVEPEVPDPFLLDDPDDPFSEDEDNDTKPKETDIPLTSPGPIPSPRPILAVSKSPISDEDEDDAPEIYLPGLVIPTMFLPIPMNDPLGTLLTKHIHPPEKRPVRDLTGEWQRSDFHTLVMTNSWRALARMARDRIVSTDPEEVSLILGLWYLRLSSLSRLRLFNQTSAECTNLFSVLNSLEPPATRAWLFNRLLPFELEVMYARLRYWSGDHMAYLDALNALLRKCRQKAKTSGTDVTTKEMWVERGARISLITASQLMEMKDYPAAAKHLSPLCSPNANPSPELLSSLARIYLQSGNLKLAKHYFSLVEANESADLTLKNTNKALIAAAEGEWETSSRILREEVERDAANLVAVNNLSVSLLSEGKLKEGIDVLEAALKAFPSSVVVAEPFLFNLSTLYELRSATAAENKRNLLIQVAQWSGDGLKTTCLKMPSS